MGRAGRRLAALDITLLTVSPRSALLATRNTTETVKAGEAVAFTLAVASAAACPHARVLLIAFNIAMLPEEAWLALVALLPQEPGTAMAASIRETLPIP